MQELDELLTRANEQVANATDLDSLDQIRVNFLGKNGELTALLKNLGKLSPKERPIAGQAINKAKANLQAQLQQQKNRMAEQALLDKCKTEAIDVTLPGRGQNLGALHPINQTRARIEQIFTGCGFSIEEGPEIEDDFHNFSALNIPDHHPARALHDTFYLENGDLLRTHTSTVQIRTMENTKPPIKIIAPGRAYRCDSDMTHTPMFHQLEGLWIDENISFKDLKAILHYFLETFFERKITMRLRPSYFPFTEPSAEVDIQCKICQGKGCRTCGQSGWLEILGCGMVHPNVFNAVNIDPEIYSGFAFGLGIDRLTMMRYGIDDLRLFFENDTRFLSQF